MISGHPKRFHSTAICKEVQDLFAKLVSISALQLLSFLFSLSETFSSKARSYEKRRYQVTSSLWRQGLFCRLSS